MDDGLKKQTALLMELGLTRLKARAYLSLLKNGSSTGYQVAKRLSEPVANTYKALESLRNEGLILMEEGGKAKSYTARHISSYLDQRERWFSRKREIVENSLKSIVPSTPGEGFYTIESTEQLYTLSSSLLEMATDTVAVDGTPLLLEQTSSHLRKAAKRCRSVLVKSYGEIAIEGCTMFPANNMKSPVTDLPIQFLHIVVPGQGYIMAVTDHEITRLLRGVFVRDLVLSILAYNGLTMELFVTRAFDMLHQGRSGDDVMKEWGRLTGIAVSRSSGWRDFVKSIGVSL